MSTRILLIQIGGILTVADDLLKNDGKKFIEMMEQLAERRMRREEDAQYASAGLGHPSTQPHSHGPPPEDDGYDDEEDEEYDSQEDEEYDDEELVDLIFLSCQTLVAKLITTGDSNRRATHGGRPSDVPNIRSKNVRTESLNSLPRESS